MKVLVILLGYVSGSVLYAYLLPKYLCHIDVTKESPDQNPGAANAFLQAGIPMGILVIVLEIVKGYWPVRWGLRFMEPGSLWIGLLMAAPVIGHAYPLWRGGRGGKAIAVSFGVLLGIWPQYRPLALLILFYLIFSLVIRIQPHLHRSIVTFGCFFIGCLWVTKEAAVWLGSFLIAAIVISKHIQAYQGEKIKIGWDRISSAGKNR